VNQEDIRSTAYMYMYMWCMYIYKKRERRREGGREGERERLARSPASLLITSSGIQQPSRPSHDTTQSNKPPIHAAVYIYSRRAASSAIHRETRLCSGHKRPSYDMHLSPAPHVTHAVAFVAGEYVPAQQRDA
jgi:hypothetical protein